MFRLLSASKDTYITNKIIAGSECTTSNVGQAGTLDLFKLYNETQVPGNTGSIVEVSRLLLEFDYSELQALTSSLLNLSDPSFKAYINLKNIYGGQTVPSNFSLRLLPVSKSWDEGRGFDVIGYRDLDSCNFITASQQSGIISTWVTSGANAIGNLGSNVDVISSGNLGSGLEDLSVSQLFSRGDENFFVDVTKLVSASVAGILPNYGFRISFSEAEEEDSYTRFVKRFGSRHTSDKSLHPKLIIHYDDSISDDSGNPFLNVSQSLFVYNSVNGQNTNFVSGSSQIVGDDSLLFVLEASKSVSYFTSSFSLSHSASITHKTSSLAYLSRSYLASQFSVGTQPQPGVYFADLNLNIAEDEELREYLSGANSIKFNTKWKSLDSSLVFASQYMTFKNPVGGFSNSFEKNYTVNITNLKQTYHNSETARLRLFVQDNNTELAAYKTAVETKSLILKDVKWRLIKAFSKKEIIPFTEYATKLSTDGLGMYFDIYMQDLDANELYEIELMITEGERDFYIKDKGFIFKVVR